MFVAPVDPPADTYRLLAELLFDFCFRCFLSQFQPVDMSAVPQGAFAARKVAASIPGYRRDTPQFYQQTCTELSPLKYNSKLMNSIWGLYNRYSVHNFKKITDAEVIAQASQDAGSKASKTAQGRIPSEWVPRWPPAHIY